jgi:hypothetical protein
MLPAHFGLGWAAITFAVVTTILGAQYKKCGVIHMRIVQKYLEPVHESPLEKIACLFTNQLKN